LYARVVSNVEAKLVDEKAEAAVLIADVNIHAVNAKMRGRRSWWERTAHGRHYRAEPMASNTTRTA
jgi:hypothetical protein